MMKHIQTWLLITLLVLSATDLVNAKFIQGYPLLSDAQGRLSQYIEPNDIRTNVSYKVYDGCFAYSTHERWYQQRIRDGESETRTYYDGLDREVGTRTRGYTLSILRWVGLLT